MIKLADTLAPMADFPAVEAKDVTLKKADGTEKSIQNMYNDGELGDSGDDSFLLKLPGVQNFLASKKRYSNSSNQGNNNVNQFLTFLHITDIHADSDCYLTGRKLADKLDMSGVLMTGDIVANTGTDDFSFVSDSVDNFTTPLYTVIGNHDTKNLSESEAYKKYIAPFATKYNYQTIVGTSANNFYVDLSDKKLRIIGIDPYGNSEDTTIAGHYPHYTEGMFTFLCNALNDTPENYGIIICMHAPEKALNRSYQFDLFKQPETFFWTGGSGYSAFTDIVDAYISGNSITVNHTNTMTDSSVVNFSFDFSSKHSGTEFIAWVTGHAHTDNIAYVPDTVNTQLMLCMACSGLEQPETYDINYYNDLARTKGTDSQYLFNTYVIDRERKMVKICRIGAHLTYDLVDRNYMEISYV